MSHFVQDIRYALRLFAQDPGFTTVAILTLALGIGATTGAFSIIDGVLLRPLPYPDGERLVFVGARFDHDDGLGVVSPGNLADLADRSVTLEAVAGSSDVSFTVLGTGDPELVDAVRVGRNFFSLMGIEPHLGRGLVESDYEPDASDVAVLDYAYWQDAFGGDPSVVGEVLTLDREPYTVVGVGPEDYFPPDVVHGHADARMWVPLRFIGDPVRTSFGYQALARLAPGANVDEAALEVDRIFRGQTAEYGLDFEVGGGAELLRDRSRGTSGESLLVLLVAVALLLGISCANVANLMLARGTRRRRELAVRRSLGADRWRITRQLTTESLVLALVGGALGSALSYWAVLGFKLVSPPGMPRLAEVSVDLRALLGALVLSGLVGVLFGIAPSLQALRTGSAASLRAAGSGASSRRPSAVLVVAEMALALMLLIGAGLMVNSFVRLSSVDPGFEPNGLVSMRVNLRDAYAERADWQPFFREVLGGVQSLPGVQTAALTTSLPFGGVGIASSVVPLDTGGDTAEPDFIPSTYISEDYFRTLGINLLEGDTFDPVTEGGPLQVVVNTALAERFWPGAPSALGKRILVGDDPAEDPVATVIGVADSLRFRYDQDPMAEMFFSVDERAWRATWVVARTSGDPSDLARPMRGAVWRVDPDLPIDTVATVAELAWGSVGAPMFYSALASLLALAALALTLVGVYGTVSYGVGARVREIGVRVALGARPGRVLALILGGGARMAVAGVTLGALGGWVASRTLESFLFGVSGTDPWTYVAVCAMFVATTLLATWVPARRAARLDPVRALRSET